MLTDSLISSIFAVNKVAGVLGLHDTLDYPYLDNLALQSEVSTTYALCNINTYLEAPLVETSTASPRIRLHPFPVLVLDISRALLRDEPESIFGQCLSLLACGLE